MKSRTQSTSRACFVEPLEGRVLLSSVAPPPIDPRITVPPHGVVTGRVFDDLNANGIRDAGEKLVAGAKVTVPGVYHQDTSQTATMITYTDAAGEFIFDTQVLGLLIVKPGNTALTADGRFIDPSRVSITVVADQTTDVEVPVQQFTTISGRVREARGGGVYRELSNVKVYVDFNSNHRHDANEPEYLTIDGTYLFERIPAGNTVVRLEQAPPNTRITSEPTGVAVRGKAVVFPDLLVERRPTHIKGVVYLDQNGNGRFDKGDRLLSGIRVHVDSNTNRRKDSDEAIVLTDESGRFAATSPSGRTAFRIILPQHFPALGAFSSDGQRQVFAVRTFDIPAGAAPFEVRIGLKPRR